MPGEVFAAAAQVALTPSVVLAVTIGIALGVTVGAVPGISGDMAMALLLPLMFSMETAPAIGMLMGVYKGALFGGSISAIMFGVPGTPGAAATIRDGFQAKLAGAPNKALHTSLYSSVIGDVLGVFALIFLATPLAMFALRFGPSELFALYLVSLAVVVSLDRGRVAQGLAAASIGVLLAMVGRDPFSGATRLTFGLQELTGGFGLAPVLIGLFAVSEIMLQAVRLWHDRTRELLPAVAQAGDKANYDVARDRLTWAEYRSLWRAVGVGSATGTIIGALPGAGATLAAFLSYGLAQRLSARPELFGRGSLEGIAAPEAGNSATAGATMIPLFAFGIPGSGSAALVGAAFMMRGISPGPTMLEENLVLMHAIFAMLLYGSLLNLVTSSVLLPYYARISMLQPRFVMPIVLALALLGTYATDNAVFDVWVLIGAGVLGVFMRACGMPLPPAALGFILAPGLEAALRQSLILGQNDWGYLLQSSLAASIYAVGAALILLFFWATRR